MSAPGAAKPSHDLLERARHESPLVPPHDPALRVENECGRNRLDAPERRGSGKQSVCDEREVMARSSRDPPGDDERTPVWVERDPHHNGAPFDPGQLFQIDLRGERPGREEMNDDWPTAK